MEAVQGVRCADMQGWARTRVYFFSWWQGRVRAEPLCRDQRAGRACMEGGRGVERERECVCACVWGVCLRA